MDDGIPTLEVGFAIDAGGSFDTLAQLDRAIDTSTANAIAEFAKIEKATAGAVNLSSATASITTFGAEASRAARDASRELAKVERSGEALVRQLERQNAVFGKSREEIRGMKAEAAALAAEQQGLSDLAARIRNEEQALFEQEFAAMRRARQEAEALAEERARVAQQAAVAAEIEARAIRDAAAAHAMFEARVRQGIVAMREQEAAERAIAREQSAAALRAEAAAAAKLADEHARLAAELRGSHAAQEADAASLERLRRETDPLYAATTRINSAIAESTRLYYAGVTPLGEYERQQMVLAQRLRDTAEAHDEHARMVRRGANSMTQFSFQVNDVITMATLGAPPMQIFFSQFGQIAQIAQTAEGGVRGFAGEVGSMVLRFAPLIAVAAVATGAFALFSRTVSQGIDTKAMTQGLGLTHNEIKRLKDVSISTGDVVTATFQVLTKNVGISLGGVKTFFADAMDFMTVWGRRALAGLYAYYVGTFKAIGVIVKDVFAGKGIGEIMADVGNSYKGAFKEADNAMIQFGQDVTKQLKSNKLADLKKQAAEIKASRAPDRHAETIQREAAATEAQIRNLYSLADAYRVSGAAALIAEARVKAESQAIKQRGDIEASVDRQIRLAIAQRVSDAAKSAPGMINQARAQEDVNAMVSAGIIPAERAAELVRDRIADLPLLAAIEAAQQRGLRNEVVAATRALDEQRAATERANAAARDARFVASMSQANDELQRLQLEARLVGETDAARVRALATLKAWQDAYRQGLPLGDALDYVDAQVAIAKQTQANAAATRELADALSFVSDQWDLIARNVQNAARGMSDAFGRVGQAVGDMASIYADFRSNQERADLAHEQRLRNAQSAAARDRENALFTLQTSTRQVGLYGDMATAAKGFFKEGSSGYQALATAEKAFRAVEFALSVRAMVQDTIETGSKIANSVARTAAGAVEAVVNAIKSLPFPLNLAAGAATVGALASLGISIAGSFGGGSKRLEPANEGTGTTFGDSSAKSASLQRSIDMLREIDATTNVYAREMAASLRSIDSQIGNLASVVVRAGNISADDAVSQGFKKDELGKTLSNAFDPFGIGSKIPIVGGILGGISGLVGSLFGTKTKVIGSGLFGGSQSIADILSGGLDLQTYSDVEKTKKFLGVSTSKKLSTIFGAAADQAITDQFTLILRSFNDAIVASAGPLGVSTSEIASRVSGFVFDLGKIDLKGLTGEEVQDKLTAVFGAAADEMARAGFPEIDRFQKVGEGAFETLTRVATTVETVTTALNNLGAGALALGIDAKMSLADQFDSVSAFADAADSYFTTYFSKSEQAAARTAQFATIFDSLGLAMPSSIAGFRQLVEAQNLTTEAGRDTYATLLQIAPAFAELQTSLLGAKSAADILSERQDLERQLLEAQGNSAAIRDLDLAKLDASNRGLQEQIWAVQDAKAAADAAKELRDAWTSVGDSIMDEIKRIRGLTDANTTGGFAAIMGQFNAASTAARGGDQDAAKSLPGLSQALLTAAAQSATSSQELKRVQAQTAASLQQTYDVIGAMTGTGSNAATLAVAAAQASSATAEATDSMLIELRSLRSEVAQLRSENTAGHAATAGNTARVAKKLDDVTQESGGTAISVANAA